MSDSHVVRMDSADLNRAIQEIGRSAFRSPRLSDYRKHAIALQLDFLASEADEPQEQRNAAIINPVLKRASIDARYVGLHAAGLEQVGSHARRVLQPGSERKLSRQGPSLSCRRRIGRWRLATAGTRRARNAVGRRGPPFSAPGAASRSLRREGHVCGALACFVQSTRSYSTAGFSSGAARTRVWYACWIRPSSVSTWKANSMRSSASKASFRAVPRGRASGRRAEWRSPRRW